MTHREYVAARQGRSARFAMHQSVAKAELALSQTVLHHRESLGLSYDQLTTLTGIPVERLEAIEEGDTVTLAEVLWLCHALAFGLSIDAHFNLAGAAAHELQALTQ